MTPDEVLSTYDLFELHRHTPDSPLVLSCIVCAAPVFDFHMADIISVSVLFPLVDGHMATHHTFQPKDAS